MEWVIITAITVGAATMLGAGIGLILRKVSETVRRCMIATATGIMLHSVMFGLIQPALSFSNRYRLPMLLAGLFFGFLFLSFIRAISPKLFGLSKTSPKTASLLFIFAMGIHHIPEGIAAGVSFGTENISDIVTVCGGIILQNIPEGMVLIAPLRALGLKCRQILGISLGISLLEAAGVFLGYGSVSFSTAILPFALGFAAGTMIYVMFTDMIPDSCPAIPSQKPVYCALGGFGVMCVLELFFA